MLEDQTEKPASAEISKSQERGINRFRGVGSLAGRVLLLAATIGGGAGAAACGETQPDDPTGGRAGYTINIETVLPSEALFRQKLEQTFEGVPVTTLVDHRPKNLHAREPLWKPNMAELGNSSLTILTSEEFAPLGPGQQWRAYLVSDQGRQLEIQRIESAVATQFIKQKLLPPEYRDNQAIKVSFGGLTTIGLVSIRNDGGIRLFLEKVNKGDWASVPGSLQAFNLPLSRD